MDVIRMQDKEIEHLNYEQPQAIYPVLPPPSTEEKRVCTHSFKDITAFGSPYIAHICIWCGKVRRELRR